MAVLNVLWPQTGLVPNSTGTTDNTSLPTVVYILTNDTLATVTTAGYLNHAAKVFGAGTFNNSQMALVYTSDVGQVWLRVVITFSGATASYSLDEPSSGSSTFTSITLGNGTAAAPSLNFISDTTTGLYRAGAQTLGFAVNGAAAATLSATAFTMLGGVYAGTSGTAGTLRSYPATAANGYLEIVGVANGGARNAVVTNAALAQTTTFTIPDPGAATATFLLNTGTNTMAAGSTIVLAKANGVEAANAVTASGNAGVITTSALTTAAGASYAITWTNTKIATSSVISLSIMGGTNTVKNFTMEATAGAGTSTLTIYNNDPLAALNGTIFIGYTVF